jgi:hypothetical protein
MRLAMGCRLIFVGTVFVSLLNAALGQEAPRAHILVGRDYPQYEQVSAAFAAEWERALGQAPAKTEFPILEPHQQIQLIGNPDWVICLGEAPTTWAIQREEPFALGFTMVVAPDRIKQMRDASPDSARQVTAVSIEVPIDDELDIAKQVFPKLRTIGLLTQDSELRDAVGRLRQACQARQVQLIHVELADASELPEKLDPLLDRIDLLWSLPDANIFRPQLARHIIGRCAARGVPLVGLSATFVKAGACISFERNYHEIGALLARNCLRGMSASASSDSWSIESPPTVVLSINQESMNSLGFSVDQVGPEVQINRY